MLRGMFLQVVFLLILVAGIAGLFRMLLQRAAERSRRQHRALAERFDLAMEDPPPRAFGFVWPEPAVHGRYRGREVSVAPTGKGLQNTRQIETAVKAEARAGGLEMQLTAAGVLGRMRQRDSRASTRCSTGDDSFDEAVDLRASDVHAPPRIFEDADLRRRVRETLQTTRGTLYAGKDTLVFVRFGLIQADRERESIESIVELLCDLGERIEAS